MSTYCLSAKLTFFIILFVKKCTGNLHLKGEKDRAQLCPGERKEDRKQAFAGKLAYLKAAALLMN